MAHGIVWSCGCYVEDGELKRECTQAQPQGEIAASSVGRPFSPVCFRKRAQANAIRVPTAADLDAVAADENAKDATA